MQKKLSFMLSIMLLASSTTFIKAVKDSVKDEWATTKKALKLVGLCTILGGGVKVQQMNEEYARERKEPDANLTLAKMTAASGLLIGLELLSPEDEKHGLAENLIKVGALTLAVGAGTDTVAHKVKYIPSLGAILTGPIVDGKEVKDVGAAARVVLTYYPAKNIGLWLLNRYFPNK